jgi:hypothetical protein
MLPIKKLNNPQSEQIIYSVHRQELSGERSADKDAVLLCLKYATGKTANNFILQRLSNSK